MGPFVELLSPLVLLPALFKKLTVIFRCLLSFLNLAGKPFLIVGETIAYHSCTRVFTVWLVFPPHLFVVLQSPLVQLMATHFVSCPIEPILTSSPSVLVPLLTGMPSRHL